MKKYITGCLLAGCLLPFPAAGQWGKTAKRKMNDALAAQVDFSKMRVSLLRKFPHAHLVLEDVRIIGTGAFEGDTLLTCGKAAVTFNPWSVVRRKHIKIKSVFLDEPTLRAHVAADGQANWNIFKRNVPPENALRPEAEASPPPGERPEKPSGDKTKSRKRKPATRVSMKKIEICDADLTYRDDRRRVLASAEGLNLQIVEEDMPKDSLALQTIQLHIDSLGFRRGNRDWLQPAQIAFHSRIRSRPGGETVSWDGSRLQVNEMNILLDGSATRCGDGLLLDLAFSARDARFGDLIALVPSVGRRDDFDSLQTAGRFVCNGYAKGLFNNRRKPIVGLHLRLDSAFLRYPYLPESVADIQLAMNLLYDGVTFDGSTVDIDRLHFKLGGRPFDLDLHLKTPQSDPLITAAAKGVIRLDSLARAIPLQNTQLTGSLECDFSLGGRISALENESFDGFHAQGMLELNNITLTNSRFPEGVDIPNLSVNFTPRVLKMLKSMLSGMK
jgi:hypothetical protein